MDHFAPHPASNFHPPPSAFISVPPQSSPKPDTQHQPHFVSAALPEPAKDSSISARMEQEVGGAAAAGDDGVAVIVSESEEGHKSNTNNNAVARSRDLLFRRMLVGIKDGRFFLGCFHCMDKQGNIILQDSIEYRNTSRSRTTTTSSSNSRSSSPSSSSPMEQRCLGLILIPASCRTTCHVDCTIEEQLSLLSLRQQE